MAIEFGVLRGLLDLTARWVREAFGGFGRSCPIDSRKSPRKSRRAWGGRLRDFVFGGWGFACCGLGSVGFGPG